MMGKCFSPLVPEIVPMLLKRDLSYACLPQIFFFLQNKRQDLLNPLMMAGSPTTQLVLLVSSNQSEEPLRIDQGIFKKGPPPSALWSSSALVRRFSCRRSRARRSKTPAGKLGGWSRSAHKVNYWLGLPHIVTQFKLTQTQQLRLAASLGHVLSRGTISLRDIKKLVNKVAALPAVPPYVLLSLMEDTAAATDKSTLQPVGAAKQPEVPEAVRIQLKESILSAMVRLDDSKKAWLSLVTSVKAGSSSTAMSAVSALLSNSRGWATQGDMLQVMERLRDLPWERPSVLKEVVRVLGKLAVREPVAMAELLSIAARPNLHRSAQLQLLSTFQGFLSSSEVQDFFLRAAQSGDVEVARGAAFIPADPQELKAPGVVSFLVTLFEQLLSHEDVRVIEEAMQVWSDAHVPIPLDRGLPVLTKMT
ncbi:hypothetical protein CEUSTIGMA_g8802.t1 [Chlamydomonas eustigma]|uniref:Uncharacterized protein n=1 Tax=Chlamydomonas eustigma TaxID=1157962 RepID=A0A250XE95_9CHLO|nr:hypothetical protein CEUSTIGMA_g8802.t1 [Chlamydomonas eustigma]|eukprot:GAX81371.1 hypothetical protein CEUSTIGMA_g8802.t1 [Chlamydomonas eustigma]